MGVPWRGQKRWLVQLAQRCHVVDLEWPGFANWIAVDGVVVDRWRWPGNNLYTTHSFDLLGIPSKVIRKRAGVFAMSFDLEVGAEGVQVAEVDPAAQIDLAALTQAGQIAGPGVWNTPPEVVVRPPSSSGVLWRVGGALIGLLVLALVIAFVVAFLATRHRVEDLVGLLVPFVILGVPLVVSTTFVVIVILIAVEAVKRK